MTYFYSADEAKAPFTEIKAGELKAGDVLVAFHRFEQMDMSKPGWPTRPCWATVERMVRKIEPSFYGHDDIIEVWTPGALEGMEVTATVLVKR
jgi:hypothetical protein